MLKNYDRYLIVAKNEDLLEFKDSILEQIKNIIGPKPYLSWRFITLGGSGTLFVTIADVSRKTTTLELANAKHKIQFAIDIRNEKFVAETNTFRFVVEDPTRRFAYMKDKSIKAFRKISGESTKVMKSILKWVKTNKEKFKIEN